MVTFSVLGVRLADLWGSGSGIWVTPTFVSTVILAQTAFANDGPEAQPQTMVPTDIEG